MRRAIGRPKVTQVVRLLTSGLSQREAARREGLSLGTINKIASGHHVSQFSEDSGEVQFHAVPEYECPTCRRRVTAAPCPTCIARRGR